MGRRALLLLFLGSTGVALIGGCGNPESSTVSGTVTVDGKPLEKGVITFTAPDGKSATTAIQGGKYDIRTTPGTNRVQISAPVVTGKRKEYNAADAPLVEVTEESLPERYHSKSDLTLEVKSGGNSKDWPAESKTHKP
jgi:hypothetical protein